MQVQDGNIVIGSSQTLIAGLSQHARVTRADEDGLVLGFELQDGPKSMVDIVLGKVSLTLPPLYLAFIFTCRLPVSTALVCHLLHATLCAGVSCMLTHPRISWSSGSCSLSDNTQLCCDCSLVLAHMYLTFALCWLCGSPARDVWRVHAASYGG